MNSADARYEADGLDATVAHYGRADSVPDYAGTVNRITVNPDQMGGVPCVRGLRIPVATVVNMIAEGMDPGEVIAELPPLEHEDVFAALRFAADAVSDREIPLQTTA